MNKKDNQRSRITGMLLKQTFLDMMSNGSAERITVKRLCEKAEVNRSTFYLHYSEPNDILTEIEDETIGKVREALSVISGIDKPSPDVSGHLVSFLQHIRKNDELYHALLVKNSDPHFRKKLQDVALEMAETSFRIDLDTEHKRIIYLFIVSGSIEVLTEWIKNGFSLSEQAVCKTLYLLSEGGLRSVCSAG